MRVGRMVRQFLSGCSGVMHGARLAAVARAVEGIVRGGRLTPATIGRNLPSAALPKHGIKSVDRLLGNGKMYRDRLFVFSAIAHHVLHGCEQPVILIDWTQVAGTHQALVAAVPIGGRALPIYLEVHPQKKLNNAGVEMRFLVTLSALLPPDCRPIVVSDAGFKGPFFQAVLERRWDFVGRVRGTAKAISADGSIISKEDFYRFAETTAKDLGSFELFIKQRIPCRLVLIRKRRRPGPKPPPPLCKEEREQRQAALDPWLLTTSLADDQATVIVSLYAKRMQIEELFRDAKNHRFGWSLGTVRTSSTYRATVLLLLATIAMLAVTLIGVEAERRGAHRGYQANTSKKRVLSFFVLACAILHRSDHRFDFIEDLGAALSHLSAAARA